MRIRSKPGPNNTKNLNLKEKTTNTEKKTKAYSFR